MSPLALVLVVIGLLIATTRAPFIFAPERTRSLYLSMMGTDGRMRSLGILIIVTGAAMVWAGSMETSLLATIVYDIGLLILAIAAFMIALPAPTRRLATSAWGGFSTSMLRALGLSAVVAGLALSAYGLSL
jgi:uncharacterized protein YjeT (DUF2065 family)